MKTLDLFAGVGGFRLAFDNVGYKCAFANDIDKNAKTTYDLNFQKPSLHLEDIYDIAINHFPDFDVLTGGFPCQSFSIAGKRLGFQDGARGNLFYQIADIIRLRRPKAFLLENVKALFNHDNGKTFSIIINTLQDLGYDVHYKVLNSKDYNVPQNRERVFIVGFDKPTPFTFPTAVNPDVGFRDLLETDVDQSYYITPDHKHYQVISEGVSSFDTVYQFRWSYVRANKKSLCPTITAANAVPTLVKVQDGIRKLTPRELFRFQGFPDTFQLPDLSYRLLHHQAGNSVTVPVIQAIAEQMKPFLS